MINNVCNICGWKEFSTGPNLRLSDTGIMPRCTKCGSLERHRSNRFFFQLLPLAFLKNLRVLQFSPDPAIDPTWFKKHELSVYGGSNSLDIQSIDRDDGSYDLISLSHVLEFIPNDFAAINEILRVVSDTGFIHLVMSKPYSRTISEDYRSPTGFHQYYHLYGLDFANRFEFEKFGVLILAFKVFDPITKAQEEIHFLSRSQSTLKLIAEYIELAKHHLPSYHTPELIEKY